MMELDSVGGGQESDVGIVVSPAVRATGPDLSPQGAGHVAEAQRMAGGWIDRRGGVELAPTVVVLPGGSNQLLATRMLYERGKTEQRQDPGRQVSMIALRHHYEGVFQGRDDQGSGYRGGLSSSG